MRYVKYAREARVSIYSTEINVKKPKKKAGFLARRNHLLIKKARSKHLTGQSSRMLAVKRSKVLLAMRKSLLGQISKLSAVDQGDEINDLAESTVPEDSTGLGESGKADCPHQAGLDSKQNFYGSMHGAAVAAVAEMVSIACARTMVAEDKELFLGEQSISYLSAARTNAEVIVDGSVVRSGRNLTVVAVEFKLKETEQLVYTARGTFYNMPLSKL
ncbi:uncharacterized protein LOC122298257 isoform X3 [Carya illinoinensis]|nr:uncharacterized protein LOC122298257 isoform X3 [Carya illinoinensis]